MSEAHPRPEDEQAIDNRKEDIELFERLAERYDDHEAGRAFELAAQSLREER